VERRKFLTLAAAAAAAVPLAACGSSKSSGSSGAKAGGDDNAPVELTGRMRATLWIASETPDTDFIVRVADVHPNGYVALIADGQLRARYRKGFDKPEKLPIDRERLLLALERLAGCRFDAAVFTSAVACTPFLLAASGSTVRVSGNCV